MTALNRQALLSTDKHANQHMLSRLIVEGNSAELRALAESVEQYTDRLIEALDAAEKLATQQGNIAVALLDEVTTLRRNADGKAPELRAQLIDADNELETLRLRIAELEAREVMLPTPYPKGYGLAADKYNFALEECADAIRAAGIGVKGE